MANQKIAQTQNNSTTILKVCLDWEGNMWGFEGVNVWRCERKL